MHGGISSFVTSLSAINDVDRKREPPDEECLFSDLLWADPAEDDEYCTEYSFNEIRGFSTQFKDVQSFSAVFAAFAELFRTDLRVFTELLQSF